MFDLYLITDDRLPDLVGAVRQALQGASAGRVAVQLRAKQRSSRELLQLATALRALTAEHGAALFVNDRVDIAVLCGADGVQLPEQAVPVASARALLPAGAHVGVSCHDAAGLARAARDGASFATLSPVYESPGKGPALGCDRFAALASQAPLPVYALGGVRPEHARALRSAGAAGLAVISAVSSAPDPALALHACLRAWADAETEQPPHPTASRNI